MAEHPSRIPDFGDFAAWYSARQRRLKGKTPAPATIRTKRVHLGTCSRIVRAETPEMLSTVLSSRSQVEHLLDELAVRMTPGSMQPPCYALLDFCQYATHKGWMESPAIYRSDVPAKDPAKPITIYTDAELELFTTAARGADLRWWALLCFLADTGRRIGEALQLRWEWLKLDGDVPYFELPHQKNGNPQYIPLGTRLREEVFTPENIIRLKEKARSTTKEDPAVLVFPYSYSSVHGRLERFCEKTGLPNRGLHNFRHTRITNWLIKGVPLQAASALAGHANPGITGQRYNHAHAMSYKEYLD